MAKHSSKIENKTQPSLCLQTWLQQNLRISTNHQYRIQGGSDKSGILKIFLETHTAQLKIIRFYKSKKKLAQGHIENEYIQ
jgi:hypothetical protein